MARHLMIAATTVYLMSLAPAAAQTESTLDLATRLASNPPQFSETFNYALVFPEAPGQPEQTPVSHGLLDLIASWLGANFDLPVARERPRIEITSAARIAAMRYGQPAGDTSGTVVAVYGDETNTIFLPQGWTGISPAEHSMLVHEMVHHLQHQAQLSYGCPEEREKLAYEAQSKWLALFGTTLGEEFGLDPFTVLAKTLCRY